MGRVRRWLFESVRIDNMIVSVRDYGTKDRSGLCPFIYYFYLFFLKSVNEL